ALYAAADLFVSPTWHEGFGLPIVEAMAVGVPVVTSDVTTLPEITAGCAELIDPHNTKDIGRAIHKVLSDRALQLRMMEAGHERAKVFTWHKMGKEVINLYMEVLKGDK